MLRPKHCKSLEVRPKDLLGWLPMTRGLALYYSLDRVGDGVVTNLASDSRSPSADLSAVNWSARGRSFVRGCRRLTRSADCTGRTGSGDMGRLPGDERLGWRSRICRYELNQVRTLR